MLVMEYINGGTVASLLESHKAQSMSVSDICTLILNIGDALRRINANHIVHGDVVNLHNIMFRRHPSYGSYEVVFVDFGEAELSKDGAFDADEYAFAGVVEEILRYTNSGIDHEGEFNELHEFVTDVSEDILCTDNAGTIDSIMRQVYDIMYESTHSSSNADH